MKIAIAGFPGCGKSTCFKAITRKKKNEFEKLDPTKPHIAAVKIPDPRLEKLKDMFSPKKLTHSEIVFEDLPGFYIQKIKEIEAVSEVIGLFAGRNPIKDVMDMDAEFMLADLAVVEHRLSKLEKELKGEGSGEKKLEYQSLLKCKKCLDENTPLRALTLTSDEDKAIRGFQFLSRKPIFIIGNTSENEAGKSSAMAELDDFCRRQNLRCIEFSAKLESEIADLDESERDELLKEMGIDGKGPERVIELAQNALGYITFFTVKGDETKAWSVKEGTSAIAAAGKVHSDMQKGFIKAEVINFDDLVTCGSKEEAKKKGLLKLEAKEYKIRDGDIIDFRFSK